MGKWRLGEHTKKQVKDCRGVTLVELIVTFALIGLFMTAATSMLTSTLKLFTRMQATSRAITVSDMLLDKIAGEITAAIVPPENSTNGYYFWLQPKSVAKDGEPRWVVFRNRSKSPIAIFAAEAQEDGKADIETMGQGELFIRYYSVSENEGREVHELDWHFDSRVYMGYSIDKLWFEQEYGDKHPNVLKIHLTLSNPRTGFVYSTFRYAENYNYDGMYMSERDDGKTNFPLDKGDGLTGAIEFAITGSGAGEDEDPKVDLVKFQVICRVKQDDGSYIKIKETDYEEMFEGQFTLAPEEQIQYLGKTYRCLSQDLDFKVGSDTQKEYYFEYQLFNEDEYFQGIIPLDPNGWWRTPDIPVNESNGNQIRRMNPSGIAKWEEPQGESYYYVVIKQISGTGYNTQKPGYFNETSVIKIYDLEILNYEIIKLGLRPEQGSEFHARVFLYKGGYYVRLGYRNPLGSPEEQPSEWYKLP